MGSTGHTLVHRNRAGDFSISSFLGKSGVLFKGKVPEKSGLEPTGANKITIKVAADNRHNVLFQFKLSKDRNSMYITGYYNGKPEVRTKVAVNTGSPSLDRIIATGTKQEVTNATKMKDLFAKSDSIKESNLNSIAQELLRKVKR